MTDAGEIKVAFLRSGKIVLKCYQLAGEAREELRTRAHGHIDHFVIPVLDIDKALHEALRRGGVIGLVILIGVGADEIIKTLTAKRRLKEAKEAASA
jgi:hypothetical protein